MYAFSFSQGDLQMAVMTVRYSYNNTCADITFIEYLHKYSVYNTYIQHSVVF